MNVLSDENFDLLIKSAGVTGPTKVYKATQLAEAGKLSGKVGSEIFNFLASERYGSDKLAVSKFMADSDGQALNNALVRAESAAKRGERREPFALDSHNPANDQRAAATPNLEDADEETETNATEGFARGSDTPNELRSKYARYAKEMILAHAQQEGVSEHHAIDALLRTSPYFRQILSASKLGA